MRVVGRHVNRVARRAQRRGWRRRLRLPGCPRCAAGCNVQSILPVVASSAWTSFHPLKYMMPSTTIGVTSRRAAVGIGYIHAAPSTLDGRRVDQIERTVPVAAQVAVVGQPVGLWCDGLFTIDVAVARQQDVLAVLEERRIDLSLAEQDAGPADAISHTDGGWRPLADAGWRRWGCTPSARALSTSRRRGCRSRGRRRWRAASSPSASRKAPGGHRGIGAREDPGIRQYLSQLVVRNLERLVRLTNVRGHIGIRVIPDVTQNRRSRGPAHRRTVARAAARRIRAARLRRGCWPNNTIVKRLAPVPMSHILDPMRSPFAKRLDSKGGQSAKYVQGGNYTPGLRRKARVAAVRT